MKKLNKKGFTIVELVIVIAVIAILAAVLIPTFSGVVQKANDSAALQGARNAFTSYMTEHADDDGDVDLVLVKGEYAYVVENGQINATKVTTFTSNAQETYTATTAAEYNAELTGSKAKDDFKAYVVVDKSSVTSPASGTTYYQLATGKSEAKAVDDCEEATYETAGSWDAGKTYYTKTLYTEEEAKTYNATLDGAVEAGGVKTKANCVVTGTVGAGTYTIVSDVTAEGGWTIYSK